jgi:2-phospho-L-lactate transferase/gluconeogenesis factor (CofD/UPF0052 family)
MTRAQSEESAPVVGTVVQGPAGDELDTQRLRDEIERTREHLGATVDQLVARVDVKSRARAEAAELTARLRRAGAQARQAAPGYARQAMAQGSQAARQQALPLSVAAGILAAVWMVIWQRRRR